MNNLIQRSLTGLLFIAVIIGCVVSGFIPLAIIMFFAMVLSLYEFNRMVKNQVHGIGFKSIAIVSSLIFWISVSVASGYADPVLLISTLPLLFFFLIRQLYQKEGSAFLAASLSITAIIYIAVPFSLMLFIGFPEGGEAGYMYQPVLAIFLLVWSSDTGAYVSGRILGSRKLFESISPNKTWEGFLGGLFLTLLCAGVLSVAFDIMHSVHWYVLAVIVTITGALGDLIESRIKRIYSVKDSGSILPGHGGILDRFDAMLLASPFAFTYLFFVFNKV